MCLIRFFFQLNETLNDELYLLSIPTNIEGTKCAWLVVQVLETTDDPHQRHIIEVRPIFMFGQGRKNSDPQPAARRLSRRAQGPCSSGARGICPPSRGGVICPIQNKYGKPDAESVQWIKAVDNELGLEQRFCRLTK